MVELKQASCMHAQRLPQLMPDDRELAALINHFSISRTGRVLISQSTWIVPRAMTYPSGPSAKADDPVRTESRRLLEARLRGYDIGEIEQIDFPAL